MKVVIFDTETDGLIINPERQAQLQPRIVEICLLVLEQIGEGAEATFSEVECFSSLVNPGRPIDKYVSNKSHHITDEMVAGSPSFGEIAGTVGRIFREADLAVAHNISFDHDILDMEFNRFLPDGIQPIAWPEILCTVEQTEHWYQRRITLSDLHEMVTGERFKDAHRAEADVRALGQIFRFLVTGNWGIPERKPTKEEPTKTA